MAKKRFLTEGPAYNPIASQLAADISGPATVLQPQPPPMERPNVVALPEQRQAPKPLPEASQQAPRKPEPTPQPKPASRYVELNKKVKVGRDAFLDLEDLLRDVHSQTGTQIPYSIVTRAAWNLVLRARAELMAQLKTNPLGPLPCTRDRLSFATFEDRLTDALVHAVKKLPRTG